MIDSELYEIASKTLQMFREMGASIATAESCTGGMITGVLTEVPGSSDVVDRGFVTYTNAAKSEMLGVDPDLIKAHGAVSAQVARAMAQGAMRNCSAEVCVAVTGVAGPGHSERKPAGLVYIAGTAGTEIEVEEHRFIGDRAAVRRATVVAALDLAIRLVSRAPV
ncbi:MAG: CinA family protein [Pseudomonadota bacterium]|nr:CinA family protein [Pseudomonadota bacterium]